MDEIWYVYAWSQDDPAVEQISATSIDEANEILDDIWNRGPAWDGYITQCCPEDFDELV